MDIVALFAAVAMVAILVFIHELGHFLAAKACGVAVTEFSFGFGRRLVGFVYKGTDYRISLLPFGGYVRMAGADPFGYGEDDEVVDPSQSFMRKPVWQRLIIMAAGPAMNLALPVVVFTGLLMAGEPQPASVIGMVPTGTPAAVAGLQAGDAVVAVEGEAVGTWVAMAEALESLEPGVHTLTVTRTSGTHDVSIDLPTPDPEVGFSVAELGIQYRRPSTEVGVSDPESPAAKAGVASGERILAIDGVDVKDWVDVERLIGAVAGSEVALEVQSLDGAKRDVKLVLSDWLPLATGLPVPPEESWGLSSATLFVGSVGETLDTGRDGMFAGCAPSAKPPQAPAHVAGLRAGDRFLRLDGAPVRTWSDVLEAVGGTMSGDGETAVAREIRVDVMREGKIVSMTITPQVIKDTDIRGVYFYRPVLGVRRLGTIEVDGPTVRRYYTFPEAFDRASRESIALAGFIFEHLGRLVTGEAAFEKSVGGPVEIVRQASMAAKEGIFQWARLMGGLSISLGIINFLPVPVLDGGQFLFYLLEGIRGRPLSLALRERAQQVGVLMIVLLMLTVLVTDLHRWIDGMN